MKAAHALALLAGILGLVPLRSAHAQPDCLPMRQATAVELPELGVRKAKTVHRVVHFPLDAECLKGANGSRQAIIVALAAPPTQVTISSISKRKVGMVPVQVTLLDSAWNPLRHFMFSEFTQRGLRRSLAFHLDPALDPRFLLVELDTGALGRSDSLVSGESTTVVWAAGGVMGTITNGSERTLEMPYVDVGDVDIEFTRFEQDISLLSQGAMAPSRHR